MQDQTTDRIAHPAHDLAPTLLLHKPSGVAFDEAAALLVTGNRLASDRASITLTQEQLYKLHCITPLETGASGLVVFTQDMTVRRKLVTEAAYVEHEFMVHVTGDVTPEQLEHLLRPKAHVSISTNKDGMTGLRFALKAYRPGDIADNCARAGLEVQAMKRLRIGRMPVAKLAPEQWRGLMGYERF